MDDSEQDKSELPTPLKLKRAREKGSVARGMDLGFFTGLFAFLCYGWIAGAGFAGELAHITRSALVTAPGVAGGTGNLVALIGQVFAVAVRPVAVMAGLIFVVVLLFEVIQTGLVFSPVPLKPDFSRLNPAKGLKRLFTVRMLIETAKNILKLCVYSAIAYWVIRGVVAQAGVTAIDAARLVGAMARAGFRLAAWFLVAALFFVALDQMIVRRDFGKKMRMSRRELRREVRDREGEPRMKQRRKQLHAEFVKLSESLRNVRGADVVITNPMHYAVALRYDPARMAAPVLLSRGANAFALRLKRLAFVYGIVIVEDKALAQRLYRHGRIDREIPQSCYQDVADIYLSIRAAAERKRSAPAHV